MSHVPTARIGRIEVRTICEGFAPIALSEELPGVAVDWPAERDRHPWAFVDGADAWPWHVHAFVLTTPSGVLVVDSGLGPFPPYRPWAEHDADAWAGVDPTAVRHVVLTHLHSDHAGGVVPDTEPRFPNAVHTVHPADWAYFADRDEHEEYTARRRMQVLAERGALDLRPLDHDVVPGVSVRHTPGHTPGHRSVMVTDDDQTLLLTGDLLHLPVQAVHAWDASSHDVDPLIGAGSRRLLLFDARDQGWRVGVGHFARPFGRIAEDGWVAEPGA